MEFQIAPPLTTNWLLVNSSSSVAAALGPTIGSGFQFGAAQQQSALVNSANKRQTPFLIPLLNLLAINTIPVLDNRPQSSISNVSSDNNATNVAIIDGAGGGRSNKLILPSNPIYAQLIQLPYLFFSRFMIRPDQTSTTTLAPTTTISTTARTITSTTSTTTVASNDSTSTTTNKSPKSSSISNSATCGLTIEQLEQAFDSGVDNDDENGDNRGQQWPTSQINVRIVGGQQASYRDIPWQISLQKYSLRNAYGQYVYGQTRPQYRHFCGGTVIKDRWIVTAAHCLEWTLDPANSSRVLPQALRHLRIVYGTDKVFPLTNSYNNNQNNNNQGQSNYRWWSSGGNSDSSYRRQDSQYYNQNHYQHHRPYRQPPPPLEPGYCYARICDLFLNPGFRNTSSRNDIALIHLCQPLPIYPRSDKVNELCLPHDVDKNYEGTASTSGWGRIAEYGRLADSLQVANVTVLPDRRCIHAYGSHYDSRLMICAAGQYQDSCQGDSGGPLFQQTAGGRSTLIGTVSFGYGCGRRRFPGIYTKISHYLGWISDVIGNNS